jgi:hypothetical protein
MQLSASEPETVKVAQIRQWHCCRAGESSIKRLKLWNRQKMKLYIFLISQEGAFFHCANIVHYRIAYFELLKGFREMQIS